jgi:hypothetical protein
MAIPQSAYADDYSNIFEATTGRLLENLGIKSSETTKDIDYHERPPLVIPANPQLPPPEKTNAAANPAWPKDPDVKRRKIIEAQKNKGDPQLNQIRENNPLSPDQMTPGPRPSGVRAPPAPESTPTLGEILSPSQLGYKSDKLFGMFRSSGEETVKFTGEPARTSLTEPPPGYQTPSPDQPYGTGAPAAYHQQDIYERQEIQTGR